MFYLKRHFTITIIFIFITISCTTKNKKLIAKSDDAKLSVVYYENSNRFVKDLRIRECSGDLPDSIDISKIKFLRMEKSDINLDLNETKNTLEHLDVWYSNLNVDTFNLKGFENLHFINIVNTKTKFIIDDKTPVKLLSIDNAHETFALLPDVNLDKLTQLDSLMLMCRDCRIKPPKKELSFINFRTLTDTFSHSTKEWE